MNRSSLVVTGIAAVFIGLLLLSALPANAQKTTGELLRVYQFQRSHALYEQFLRSSGGRMAFRPPAHLPTPSDSIQAWLIAMRPPALEPPEPEEPSFPLESLKLIKKLEFQVLGRRFDDTPWAFLGASGDIRLDTMRTNDIRARMQHHFGDPTRTLAEIGYPDTLRSDEIVEFEYWFIVNGDIPFLVLDVNGPWDRGLVVASHAARRDELPAMKRAILSRLTDSTARKPFADYYFNVAQHAWYISGWNGARFFDVRIERPNLELGRPSYRPFLPDTEN